MDAESVRRNLERVRERIGPEVEVLAAVKYVEAADLPPGPYGLVVGWYGLEDPARLPAFEGDRPLGDAVRLATLDVRPPGRD